MKKRNVCKPLLTPIIGLTMLLLPQTVSASTDDVDKAVLDEIIKMCVADAKEDDVAKEDLLDYIATCVNDDLEANDKKRIPYETIVRLLKQSKQIEI